MMGKATIMQWNCRGFYANLEEIKSLMALKDPLVLCLQETYLKPSDSCSLRDFACKSTFSTASDGRPIGGSSVFVRHSVPHSFISLSTPLQAVAVRVHLHRLITICSLYIPPSVPCSAEDLSGLLNQLPPPILLLGDFNAHSELWGCEATLPDARNIELFIQDEDLSILNDGSHTYIHPGNGAFTSIDLSLCSPVLYLDFIWRVAKDQCGSDHYPIFLSCERHHSDGLPNWQLQRANWSLFESLCQAEISQEKFEGADSPVDLFSATIIDIAGKAIPKSSTKSMRQRRPWFTVDCKKAIRLRRAALQRFSHFPTADNLSCYRQARAEARRVVKAAKRTSWRAYVSKLNSRSSVKKAWDMVRKISGRYRGLEVHHVIQRNGSFATDKESIAEALADEFALNSSTHHYTSEFQAFKAKAEREHLNFTSVSLQPYNAPFTLLELELSLKSSHDTAVGPDEIHYQFLKHLPLNALMALLSIFNNIWEGGSFPLVWRNATVVPIPKPGKDISNPTNYRPIALTSCLCKTMERMVNGRLVHYLEVNKLLSPSQSGFRSQRSTLDHLVSLETYIRDGFVKGDHVVSIFFDLEKAYDTTWKYGIMLDLFKMNLRGNLPIFIDKFLSNRRFSVRLGSIFSSPHHQEMGVPQGSVLSVTLFTIKINSIVAILKPGIHNSLYVDDFTISYRSRYMPSIERHLQMALNTLQIWADQNGFRFSSTKTVCVHFCNKRALHPDPCLTLNGHTIPVVEKTKFLGLFFDRKLSFKPHIDYLRVKCDKALNLLKVVSKLNWGADRKVLLRLFRSLVRSRLDYGAAVYGSARPSYLKKLEPVQNQGLRLCLGAFRTSPVSSLHVEANEMPMRIRREFLSLQFALKVCADPEHPDFNIVCQSQYENFYNSKPSAIRPFNFRIFDSLSVVCPSLELIFSSRVHDFPYWLLHPPEIDTSLTSFKKDDENPLFLKSAFYNLLQKYPDFKYVFTDGSKCESGVACAAISNDLKIQFRIDDSASIYTAELMAIYQSLNMLAARSDVEDILILTDSLSSIQAVQNFNFKNPYVFHILEKCTQLYEHGKSVVFMWCPSHVGIAGNERADALAKQALHLPVCPMRVPFSDFRSRVVARCRSLWQVQWDEEEHNKLHDIQSNIAQWHRGDREVRREEIVLARARIGHSHLTHGYLLRHEDQPWCIPCDCAFTVKHILVECMDFSHIRMRYFNASSMKVLFEEVDPSKILAFLKAIGLFHRF